MMEKDQERKMNNGVYIEYLEIEILEMILKNQNLKLYDEDSLFDFILSLTEKSNKSFVIFENVKFESLSSRSIEAFISIFDVSYLTAQIWSSICQRLMLSLPTNGNLNNDRYIFMSLNEGLFNYLRKKYSGDPCDCVIVEITASSVFSKSIRCQPKNSINFYNDIFTFESLDYPNQWICYKFKNFCLRLSKYPIRTWDGPIHHLKNWIIETSNDGIKWDEIDRQTNCISLLGPKYNSAFDITSPSFEFVQFIRLRQFDQNWSDSDLFIFNSIEFYGEIMYKQQ